MDRRSFLKLGIVIPWPVLSWLRQTDVGYTSHIYTGGDHLCLTINCSGNPMVTRNMLDNLYANNRTLATWFISGSGLRSCFHPSNWERSGENREKLIYGNHTIGYLPHSWPTVDQTYLWTRQQWQNDFEKWDALMVEIFGRYETRYARGPWGIFTDPFLEFCEDNDLRAYRWSVDHAEMKRLFGTGGFYAGDIVLAETTLNGWQMVNIVLYLQRFGWPQLVTDIFQMERLLSARWEPFLEFWRKMRN